MRSWLAQAAAVVLAVGLVAPAPAEAAGGGGGVHLDGLYFPRYGSLDSDHLAPGGFGCLGGTGHWYSWSGLRLGGSGTWCRGRTAVSLAYGDAFVGLRTMSEDYLFADLGLGVGGFSDQSASEPYRAFFGHARLQAGYAITLWNTSMEASAVVMLPVNLAQWVGRGEPRGFVTPIVGLRITFLWGRFPHQRPEPPAPVYQPQPQPPPPPPRDDRPLAIPAG